MSVFKKVARSIGISRWPFRKRQSVREILEMIDKHLVRKFRSFPGGQGLGFWAGMYETPKYVWKAFVHRKQVLRALNFLPSNLCPVSCCDFREQMVRR